MSTRQYIAYMFELKSIQPYLMAGGKLKDMVNSSDLLEQLTQENGYLDATLKLANIEINTSQSSAAFSRRAGGAIYLIAQESIKDKLDSFRALWTLLVQQILPDCEFVDCLTQPCENAFESVTQGRTLLLQQRNVFYPALPLSTPFTQIAPRTGTAAVAKVKEDWLDKANVQKRLYSSAKSHLTYKFCDDEHYHWPSSLEDNDFPFYNDEKDVAIVHIDGNGLGQVLINIAKIVTSAPDGYIQFYSTFSDKLKQATEQAAKEATNVVLIEEWTKRQESKDKKINFKNLAARPLVLGGDDLTLIIRADLAVPFSQVFIESFEKYSAEIKKELLKILKKNYKSDKDLKTELPEFLTACGGIVFQKASQPFMMGYALAESLCTHAKGVSKGISATQIPSSLCFYQIQSSVTDNYSTILRQELTTKDKRTITLGAYGVGQYSQNSLAKLSDLQNFVSQLNKYKGISAKLRQWLGLLLSDENSADVYYEQIDKSLTENSSRIYDDLIHLLQNLFNPMNSNLKQDNLNWFNEANESPLIDLITLSNLSISEQEIK